MKRLMTGSEKYLAASITIALRVGPGKLSCVISVVMMSERSWYRWLLLKIAYHVSCSLNFDHESNCIGRYWHLSGCVSVFITFIVNRIFRCIPRKHTVLARKHASHSSSDPAPLLHQYSLVIRAIVVLNIKCLALRQHQKGERADADGHDSTLNIFNKFQRRRHWPNSNHVDFIPYFVNSLLG